MNKQDPWQEFVKTGSVLSYLNYKNQQKSYNSEMKIEYSNKGDSHIPQEDKRE